MNIIPVPVGTNIVWLIVMPGARQCAIVDPTAGQPVLAVVRERGLEPTDILITHHHADHVGGIAAIRRVYPIPVHGPANEAIPQRTHPVREGDVVVLGRFAFQVLEIPGHTLDHVAYVSRGMLFAGDTLFGAGCGRVFEGTPGQLYDALRRLAALPPNTLLYCAHEYTQANLRFAQTVEPDNVDIQQRLRHVEQLRGRDLPTLPSPLELEHRTNPFLRCRLQAVRAAAERFAGGSLRSPTDVFAVLRRWKDGF
ncbi:MAG: hydroxyacylglutathione hydrolase [Myxococcota bacterium]